ncbi:MAG: TraR/DksA C4-type zinc finger protein [Patescibacteria group bacterium]
MEKETIEKIRQKLVEEEKILANQISRVIKPDARPGASTNDAAFPEYGTSEDDNAAEVATFQDNLSLENELEKNYNNVKLALVKIKENRYGICENCQSKISDKRLLAFPVARHCLKCKAVGI